MGQWRNQGASKKKKNNLDTMKTKTQHSKIWDTGKAVLCADLPQETRKTSDKQVTLSSKGIRKEEKNKA